MTAPDTVDEGRKRDIVARFRRYCETRVPQVAAEQVALEFGVTPDEVLAWAKPLERKL